MHQLTEDLREAIEKWGEDRYWEGWNEGTTPTPQRTTLDSLLSRLDSALTEKSAAEEALAIEQKTSAACHAIASVADDAGDLIMPSLDQIRADALEAARAGRE